MMHLKDILGDLLWYNYRMIFNRIKAEDSEKYIEYLRKCPEVPADCCNGFVFGYDAVHPAARAYCGDLCWQTMEIGEKKLFFPPVGDWDNVDWKSTFREIEPRTVFRYVPQVLKEIWDRELPGRFMCTATRDDWDYIYDMEVFAGGTQSQRRLCKRFREDYEYQIEPIDPDNIGIVRQLNHEAETYVRAKYHEDCKELDEDNKAMEYILDHWKALGSVEGFFTKVKDRYVSFIIWDVIDTRVVCMFNKNIYEYRGIHELVTDEFCRMNLEKGRRMLNYTSDAGIIGLRNAKTERRPLRMLEKFDVAWLG